MALCPNKNKYGQARVKKGCKKTLMNKEREVSCPYLGETSRHE